MMSYCHECMYYSETEYTMSKCSNPITIMNTRSYDGDGIWSNGVVLIGSNFGCIHFEAKEDDYSEEENEEDGW